MSTVAPRFRGIIRRLQSKSLNNRVFHEVKVHFIHTNLYLSTGLDTEIEGNADY